MQILLQAFDCIIFVSRSISWKFKQNLKNYMIWFQNLIDLGLIQLLLLFADSFLISL